MSYDASCRMDQVLGSPPRLDPLSEGDLDEAQWSAIRRIRDITGFPQEGPVHPYYATLARHIEVLRYHIELGMAFGSDPALEPFDQELVILRTGWLCGAPFQFGEHVAKARRIGISGEAIERVPMGWEADGWSDKERAILKAVDELHKDAMISDETWAELAQWLDERQLIELPMVVGHYHQVAFVQNSLRFRLNPYNTGLAVR